MHPRCTHTLEAEAQCVCVLFLTDIGHFIKIHEGLWCNSVFKLVYMDLRSSSGGLHHKAR